jgi:hypothetical protein
MMIAITTTATPTAIQLLKRRTWVLRHPPGNQRS